MDIENLIVIVTYNSQDFIEECIKSIAASDIKKCFLAVIDNNSCDGTLEKLSSVEGSLKGKSGNQHGELNYKFISLKNNIGFSAAVNYCVFKFFLKEYPEAAANTQFLTLINPDVCVEKNTISNLVSTFGKTRGAAESENSTITSNLEAKAGPANLEAKAGPANLEAKAGPANLEAKAGPANLTGSLCASVVPGTANFTETANLAGATGSAEVEAGAGAAKSAETANFTETANLAGATDSAEVEAGAGAAKSVATANSDILAGAADSAEVEEVTGVAGSLIYDYKGEKIQHAGGLIQDNFLTSHIEKLPAPGGGLIEADYATGAVFATKLKYFLDFKGFDTGYRPVYFEEVDFCLKLKKLGLRVFINPLSVARHYEGASIGKFSPNFYRYYHKNRVRCALISLSFVGFLKKFIPAEVRWLREKSTPDQNKAIFFAYFLNFLFLIYNLAVKIKNRFLIRGFIKNRSF